MKKIIETIIRFFACALGAVIDFRLMGNVPQKPKAIEAKIDCGCEITAIDKRCHVDCRKMREPPAFPTVSIGDFEVNLSK